MRGQGPEFTLLQPGGVWQWASAWITGVVGGGGDGEGGQHDSDDVGGVQVRGDEVGGEGDGEVEGRGQIRIVHAGADPAGGHAEDEPDDAADRGGVEDCRDRDRLARRPQVRQVCQVRK